MPIKDCKSESPELKMTKTITKRNPYNESTVKRESPKLIQKTIKYKNDRAPITGVDVKPVSASSVFDEVVKRRQEQKKL